MAGHSPAVEIGGRNHMLTNFSLERFRDAVTRAITNSTNDRAKL